MTRGMIGRTTFARDERRALCDTALLLGEDAPTLAGDWTAKDLVCHLLVRERSPLGAPGISIGPLAGLTEREMARLARLDFPVLVERFRTPPLLSPLRVRVAEAVVNTLEFFVHHEDLRRAQPDWRPRTLDEGALSALWTAISVSGHWLVRPAGVPVTIRRTDTERRATLRGGDHPVVVSGAPGEIVLFLYGRARTRDLTFDGPDDAVRRLRSASLGI
jgi:uncharacterized protein (TIGR03085 family)